MHPLQNAKSVMGRLDPLLGFSTSTPPPKRARKGKEASDTKGDFPSPCPVHHWGLPAPAPSACGVHDRGDRPSFDGAPPSGSWRRALGMNAGEPSLPAPTFLAHSAHHPRSPSWMTPSLTPRPPNTQTPHRGKGSATESGARGTRGAHDTAAPSSFLIVLVLVVAFRRERETADRRVG